MTPAEIRTFVLPPEPAIAGAVERYRGFIEGSMRDPMQTESDAGRWLYTELIGKAQSLLPAGSHVVIVPDGPLHQLNFETLPVYGPKPRYWLEDAQVAVAPSFGICIHQAAREAARPPSTLIIGNPDSPGPEFPKLQYAGDEISKLHQRLTGMSTTIIAGAEARPDAYAAAQPGRFSMIHIAAHGEANRRSPLDSALILSPGDRGFKLYARDVMRYRCAPISSPSPLAAVPALAPMPAKGWSVSRAPSCRQARARSSPVCGTSRTSPRPR